MAENESKFSGSLKGLGKDGICTMKSSLTCHSDTAVSEPLLKTLFSSFIFLWFLILLWTQANFPFTLNCPIQPPIEMHWANSGVRVARCSQQCHLCPCHFLKKSYSSGNGKAPDIYTANPTPHSAIYYYIFLTHILTGTGSSQGSESHCPATQRCPGQECKSIQWWSFQQMLEHQSGFVWGIDLSLFQPWTNLNTNSQSHALIRCLSPNC